MLSRFVIVVASIMIFLMFFNGYRSSGPSRQKFKKLPETEENLIKPEPEAEVNYIAQIAHDRRLQKWITHWNKCQPGLSADSMEGMGEAYIEEHEIDMSKHSDMLKGPNKQFYISSPDGKFELNPYWDRLYYKKTEDGWEPFYNTGCAALLYDAAKKRGTIILNCSLFEGIDDAFWPDKQTIVLMGYESVTRQMSVECETVESCVAPSVWIINLKSKTMHQYHGEAMKREKCNVDSYLKEKYSNLF